MTDPATNVDLEHAELGADIDPEESGSSQSLSALMKADEDGVLIFRTPYVAENDVQRAMVLAELGEGAVLPDDDGQYYFVWINTPTGQIPIMLPESHVLPAVFMARALTQGIDGARRMAYMRELLPLPDGAEPVQQLPATPE